MLGFVHVAAESPRQLAVHDSDARRPIGGDLLADRQVQPEVQERIRLTRLRRVVAAPVPPGPPRASRGTPGAARSRSPAGARAARAARRRGACATPRRSGGAVPPRSWSWKKGMASALASACGRRLRAGRRVTRWRRLRDTRTGRRWRRWGSRGARLADVAAVQDQPVVGVLQEFLRHALQQPRPRPRARSCRARARCGWRRGRCACPPPWSAAPNAVFRITLAVLRPTPGSASRLSRSRGHLAAVLLEQDAAGGDDVARLALVQADRAHVLRQALDAEVEDRARRVGHREQLARGEVHALVGRLRREDHRHQQLERRAVLELGRRVRIERAQPLEQRLALRRRSRAGPRTSLQPARLPRSRRRAAARALPSASIRPSSTKAPGGSSAISKPCASGNDLPARAREPLAEQQVQVGAEAAVAEQLARSRRARAAPAGTRCPSPVRRAARAAGVRVTRTTRRAPAPGSW